MAIVAEIKLAIDQFAQSVRAIIDYFKQISDSAKSASKDVSKAFESSDIGKSLTELFSTKQKGFGDLLKFPADSGGVTTMLAGITKAFQGGTFAAEGFVATGLNMVARSLAMLGPQFALVVAGAFSFAIAFKAVGAAIAGAVNAIKQYTELSAKALSLGLSPETLRMLEISFQRVGGDAYAASTALDKFYANLYAARNGATDVYNDLRALSIASGKNLLPQELLKMPNEKAFYAVLDALKLIGNETQRLAISNKLFTGFTGTSGLFLKAIVDKDVLSKTQADLGPMLAMQKEMSGSLSLVGDTGRRAFSILTQGMTLVAEAFGSVLDTLAETWTALRGPERLSYIFSWIADAIIQLKPLFAFLGQVLGFIAVTATTIGAAFAGAFNVVAFVVGNVVKLIQQLVIELAETVDFLTKIATFGFGGTNFGKSLREGVKRQNAFKEPIEAPGTQPLTPAFGPVQAAIASSLSKVGGGGNIFGAGANDPLYDINRQQLRVQEQMRDALIQRNQQPTYHTATSTGFTWE